MNWSTRLRRWVRIRTPPVREPSMKPRAATVLPEPVACSNQNRRLAPGSSGASSTSSSAGSSQSWGSSSSGSRVSSSSVVGGPAIAVRGIRPVGFGRTPADPLGVAGAVGGLRGHRVLELGGERRERPGEHVDLVLGQLGPVGQLHRLGGEQPLEAQQQRVAPSPLGRRALTTGVELDDGGLHGAEPGAPRREIVRGLSLEQDRLARELAHAIELIRWDRPCPRCGDFDWFGHQRSC